MNFDTYPWLEAMESDEGGAAAIDQARKLFQETGMVIFPNFLSNATLQRCVRDARAQEDAAYTTDDVHTAYLKPTNQHNEEFPENSVYNHQMRTQVASIAADELPDDPPDSLLTLYRNPILLELVSRIVQCNLFLSQDPLGCCSINVFRPGYHHSFHFDESEFSTTLMLQDAVEGGLFQYTDPLRTTSDDWALYQVAQTIHAYDERVQENGIKFCELINGSTPPPRLHTLDFQPGTLAVFSGSKSLHRVTTVMGGAEPMRSRLVAVLTFSKTPGFCNSPEIQNLFWGRSSTLALNNDGARVSMN